MKKAGKAPDTIVVQTLELRAAAVREGVPRRAAGSIVEQFGKETGIKIKFVETTPADEYQTNMRNASSPRTAFDAVTFAIEEMGDFAEAGLLSRSTPTSRSTSRAGTIRSSASPAARAPSTCSRSTTATTTRSRSTTTRSRSSTAAISSTIPRRRRASRPSTARSSRSRRRGTSTRRSRSSSRVRRRRQMYGDIVDARRPFWCAVNWNERFVSLGRAEQLLLQAGRLGQRQHAAGHPRVRPRSALARLVTSRARSRRTGSRSTRSSAPATASWAGSFPNLTKILCRATRSSTRRTSASTCGPTSMPGRNVGGKLVRRPVIFYNISYGVNST